RAASSVASSGPTTLERCIVKDRLGILAGSGVGVRFIMTTPVIGDLGGCGVIPERSTEREPVEPWDQNLRDDEVGFVEAGAFERYLAVIHEFTGEAGFAGEKELLELSKLLIAISNQYPP